MELNTGLRVLVVDDNEINLFMMKDILEALGLSHIETAASGFEAIDCVQEKPLDLVFMDISMPEMDGYEATRKIRACGFLGRIVALTATKISSACPCFQESGMDGIVSKPVDISQIIAVLGQ